MKQVLLENAYLHGTNKAGVLKPDERGYYHVVGGVLGAVASNGYDFYLDNAKTRKTFTLGSRICDLANRNLLWGELGHPKLRDSRSKEEYQLRCRQIDEQNIVMSIGRVYLDEITLKDGKKITAIMLAIKPCGPKGHVLKQMLDDPTLNIAFSGRYFSDFFRSNGLVHREIHTVVTWDVVYAPGIDDCHKYNSATLESIDSAMYDEYDILSYHEHESTSEEMTMESAVVPLTSLLDTMAIDYKKSNRLTSKW